MLWQTKILIGSLPQKWEACECLVYSLSPTSTLPTFYTTEGTPKQKKKHSKRKTYFQFQWRHTSTNNRRSLSCNPAMQSEQPKCWFWWDPLGIGASFAKKKTIEEQIYLIFPSLTWCAILISYSSKLFVPTNMFYA